MSLTEIKAHITGTIWKIPVKAGDEVESIFMEEGNQGGGGRGNVGGVGGALELLYEGPPEACSVDGRLVDAHK